MAERAKAKKKKQDNAQNLNMVNIAVEALQDKKAKDITIIDLRQVEGSLFDYYVVCTGNSPSHIDTLSSEVDEQMHNQLNISAKRIEGLQNCQWVLLDYFDVIIHIMLEETREFYNIENLWRDAPQQHLENIE